MSLTTFVLGAKFKALEKPFWIAFRTQFKIHYAFMRPRKGQKLLTCQQFSEMDLFKAILVVEAFET